MNNETKKKETCMSHNNADIFYARVETKIGRTHFVIERHFGSNRNLEDAIYTMMKSEAAYSQQWV